MLQKVFVTFSTSLLLFTAKAQTTTIHHFRQVPAGKVIRKHLCVNDRSYTPEQMRAMEPFVRAAAVKLVSYSKVDHGKKGDYFSSIMKNGKVDTTNLSQKVSLNKEQVDMLANILFNYGNKPLPPETTTSCFLPFNAILFYDTKGKIISCIEISFGCETMFTMPAKMNIGADCSEKYDILRSFFEKAGISYFGDYD